MSAQKLDSCAVIPINRSGKIVESAYSSIVRTYELFNPKKVVILEEKFNERYLKEGQPLRVLIDQLKRLTQVKEVSLDNVSSYRSFKELIEKEVNECEKVYLIPTSGATIVAVYLTRLFHENQSNYTLVSYLFSFGAWHRFYYPFTPRPVEREVVIPETSAGTLKPNHNLLGNLNPAFNSELSSMPTFIANIAYHVKQLNAKGNGDGYELKMSDVKGGKPIRTVKVLNTSTFSLQTAIKEVGSVLGCNGDRSLGGIDCVKKLLSLSGAYELKVEVEHDDGSKEEVDLGKFAEDKIVVDTNALYYGIFTYDLKNIVVPYCAYNEILLKSSEKGFDGVVAELLRDVVEFISPSLVPTEPLQCDVAIPRVNPDLMRDALVITADDRALRLWKRSTIVRYTTLGKLKLTSNPKKCENDWRCKGDLMMSVVAFAVALRRVLDYYKVEDKKLELCWEGWEGNSPCVPVEWKEDFQR